MPNVFLPNATFSKNCVSCLLMECAAQDLKGMTIDLFLDELQLNTHTICKILSIVPLISVAVVIVFRTICEHKIHVQVAYSYCNE